MLFFREKFGIVGDHSRAELAFTGNPVAEMIGDFRNVERRGRGSQNIQQYLITDTGKLRQGTFKSLSPQCEEAAHRVGDMGAQGPSTDAGGPLAHP